MIKSYLERFDTRFAVGSVLDRKELDTVINPAYIHPKYSIYVKQHAFAAKFCQAVINRFSDESKTYSRQAVLSELERILKLNDKSQKARQGIDLREPIRVERSMLVTEEREAATIQAIINHYFVSFDTRYAKAKGTGKRIDLLSIFHIERIPLQFEEVLTVSTSVCQFALDVTEKVGELKTASRERLATLIAGCAVNGSIIPRYNSPGFFTKAVPNSTITVRSEELTRFITILFKTFDRTFPSGRLDDRIKDEVKLANIASTLSAGIISTYTERNVIEYARKVLGRLALCFKLNSRSDLVDFVQIYAISQFSSLVRIPGDSIMNELSVDKHDLKNGLETIVNQIIAPMHPKNGATIKLVMDTINNIEKEVQPLFDSIPKLEVFFSDLKKRIDSIKMTHDGITRDSLVYIVTPLIKKHFEITIAIKTVDIPDDDKFEIF
jgi:hypothetical protein